MRDPRDAEEAERLEAEAPEEHLRRREFLQRTAVTAGLGAALGTVLTPETLMAAAARRQRRVHLPSPRNLPIDTFVVLMMENRSFDHYLGWMPDADGHQAGLSYLAPDGSRHATHRLTPDFQGCGFSDPNHGWDGGRTELAGGACDGFLMAPGNDTFSIGYYGEGDLGFIQDAAQAFQTYDRFFCSLMGSTFPNREYMHAATSYGMTDNGLPLLDPTYPAGFPPTTIFDALSRKGVSNRYFFTDVPVSALWGLPGLARAGNVAEYYLRCQTGTLPHVSFVDPNFGASAGEGPGLSGDEHPHGDVRAGQAFMADVVHAFMESPQWKRGALFIVYDEWGGFFDHVAPPRVPDDRNSRDLAHDFGQMGFRIPAVAISPWVRRGAVSHDIFGFESILKMIEHRFGLKPLTRRDAYANNIARSFDFEHDPRLEPPDLPTPQAVVSLPCATGGSSATQRAKEHDLMDLVTSGYLERLGFEYRPATPAAMFREPHKIVAAHRAAG